MDLDDAQFDFREGMVTMEAMFGLLVQLQDCRCPFHRLRKGLQ